MSNNQQSQWVNGQVVNATQMTALTQDLYNKLTFITQNYKPCILYLAGDITQVDNNITIPDGAFRFEDSDNSATLQYNTGIFGNAQGTTLAVTGDGYIVARYVLNPTIPNQYNYTFATSYVFVATPIADTDVVICVITAGIISQKSGIFPYQDITDNHTNGNVIIGGRVVNSVNNIKTLNDEGKESGLVTTNDGNYLYVTEPDGETINTAVVNQYGYRLYSGGTATAILDPANTFAYVSELPVANNFIKVKTTGTADLFNFGMTLHAVYNGSIWGCTLSGSTGNISATNNVLYALYDLNATFGISGISIAAGSASSEANGDASSAIRYAKVSAQSTNLDVNAVYVNGTINNGTAFFSITFIATTVS
jgi:hypothetical protein